MSDYRITTKAGNLAIAGIILPADHQLFEITHPDQERLTELAVKMIEGEIVDRAVVKHCLCCDEIIVLHPKLGRMDRKFCNGRCKSRYHYQRRK